jgi:hypothetical protein
MFVPSMPSRLVLFSQLRPGAYPRGTLLSKSTLGLTSSPVEDTEVICFICTLRRKKFVTNHSWVKSYELYYTLNLGHSLVSQHVFTY